MSATNLSHALRIQRIRRGDAEALVDGELRLGYEQLDQAVDRHAHVLLALGVQRGDVVAILARNHATYVFELFAIARVGAIALPLNWRLHERELEWITSHAGVSVLLADAEFAGKSAVERTVVHGAPLDALLAAAPDERVPDADVALDDIQRILYTSGTTSQPKGVMQTHGNVWFNQYGQIIELELSARDRILLTAPLFHVAGLEAPGHGILAVGGTLVISPTYKGRDIVGLVAKERATGMVLAAQILYDILALPDLSEHDLGTLRYVIFGGVPVPDRRRFHAAFPGVRGVDTFGMTELTNGGCYLNEAHQEAKIGSQGTPFPFTDIRIVGPDGEELPPGQIGEIVCRGPKVMAGYWRDPEATARTLRAGWLYTGDMASIDEDGFLWFADRKRDMIRSGGENIASAEIERVIAAHDGVAEVAVIGVPDPKWDEVPKAYVIPRAGAQLTVAVVLAHCHEHLGRFKVPKHVELVAELPRNDSGKVLKRLLADPDGAGAVASMNARGEQ